MNPRIALAVLAALSTLSVMPADARPIGKARNQQVTVLDVAAVPAYPVTETTGRPGRRAASPSTKRLRTADHSRRSREASPSPPEGQMAYLPHPAGCPARAFCACGASVRIFGRSIRELWPVVAWKRFAAAEPASGNVAIEKRRSHLFVLEQHVSGSDWLVSDYNSGGHLSRRHVRDISGLLVVNPHLTKQRYSQR